jgi:hypothetical protein
MRGLAVLPLPKPPFGPTPTPPTSTPRSRIDEFLRQPLEEQLENLHLWHQTLVTVLRAFKARFRSASATLLASADAESFQAGLEGLHYEGPLKLEVRCA